MISIDLASIAEHAGEELAVSDWQVVTQRQIDQFAEATGDRQWIHVDVPRAAIDSPFKTTIAHGFLTLSLTSTLLRDAIRIAGSGMALNYGLNRVRFVSPVPSGARVRGRFVPAKVEAARDGSVQVTWEVTIERDGGDRPCCVAEWIVRYY